MRGRVPTLRALRDLTVDGWPATVREIAAYRGVSSPDTVHRQLVWLEEHGWAARHPRNPKGGWRPGIRRGEP